MNSSFHLKSIAILACLAVVGIASQAYASHSWGGYHWARTASSFTLKLGNNLSASWLPYLSVSSTEWSTSSVLDTSVVAGSTNPKNCRPTIGRLEICNNKYGNNGWLGIAQIWTNGTHITQGVVKLNDTYFNTQKYNNSSWKQMVMCQEIAHAFGLDHQDELFNNTNLGSCMDYTNDPTGLAGTNGTLNNLHPNQHDFDQLVSIYTHLDSTNTSFSPVSGNAAAANSVNVEDRSDWGKAVRQSNSNSLYERDLGNGRKVYTFVTWIN